MCIENNVHYKLQLSPERLSNNNHAILNIWCFPEACEYNFNE